MSLSKINPKNTEAWKMLIKKREEIAGIQIIDLFDSSKNRIKKFSIEFDKMFLDFSKNVFWVFNDQILFCPSILMNFSAEFPDPKLLSDPCLVAHFFFIISSRDALF